jgi:hypothetical protein
MTNSTQNTLFENFTNQYSLSKTLRFELKPVGKTNELIRQVKSEQNFDSPLAPLILEDENREQAYKTTKQLIDNLHRVFLNFALDKTNITDELEEALLTGTEGKEDSLKDFFLVYKKDSKDKKLLSIQKALATTLIKILDSSAPKFLQTLKQQTQHIQTLKEQDYSAKKELENQRKKVAEDIKQCDKSKEQLLQELREKRTELDKQISKKERAIKEYDKALKFKFEKYGNLYDKTQNTFTLLRLFYAQDEEATRTIAEFDGFNSYFTGFNENRANVYNIKGDGADDKWHFLSTSIAHRLFEQNLKFHCDNILQWDKLQSTLEKHQDTLKEKNWDWHTKLQEIEQQLNFTNQDFFSIENFINHFYQQGIDGYNKILGGLPAQENQEKQQGINELLNLTRQQATGTRQEFPPMQELYKQILSDREQNFIEVYEDNNDMLEAIDQWVKAEEKILNNLTQNNQKDGSLSFNELLNNSEEAVYVSKQNLQLFSKDITGDWNAIENWYLQGFEKNTERKKEAQKNLYTLQSLEGSFAQEREPAKDDNTKNSKRENFYQQYVKTADTNNRPWLSNEKITANNILRSFFQAKCEALIKNLATHKKNYQDSSTRLKETAKQQALNKEDKKLIKLYLDSSLDLFRFLRSLTVREKDLKNEEQNSLWKSTLNRLIENSDITNIYNKTRNFLTKKDFSKKKFKLNFQNPTLANGWDANKEKENTAILLRKNGQFFLALMDKKHNTIFENTTEYKHSKAIEKKQAEIIELQTKLAKKKEGSKAYQEELDKLDILENALMELELIKEQGEQFEKISYKLLPGVNKMLPKVFFAKSNIDFFAPSPELKEKYDKGLHKKGDNFDLKFCHQLIDFFKSSINKHPEWGTVFEWNFSKTSTYQDISGFYREVEAQGYKISFSNVSKAYIQKMVEEEKLYLFKIYNKDFSTNKKQKGTDNIHTMYWKALFEEENLKNVVAKLNGEAEIFYRKASLNYSEEKRTKGHHADELAEKFTYPIIKDKRYSEDKILFHCPITLNFKATGTSFINQRINEFLQNKSDVNIIGIDRGERNLLYFTVINQQGNILDQGSWNIITNSYKKGGKTITKPNDYHAKLDAKEKERAGARENWEAIENIKELKAGYLSQVVHQLSQLILKHNAIVVLEDLNFGFKRGRFKVEKQIYQKFEKALIDKLNYLVNKKEQDSSKAGHCLKGFQLANQFESFQKLGTQSGILFYITASYTSKTDPITGYMRSLYPKYQDAKQAQEFFGKFESVIFNGKSFEFTYNLKNMKGITGGNEDSKEFDETKLDKNWTIDSKVERSRYDQKTKKHQSANTNEELKKLFEKENIALTQGQNLQDMICNKTQTEHFQESRFFGKLISHFNRLLDMRVTDNSKATIIEKDEKAGIYFTQYIHNAESDFILSPVAPFYDSRKLKDINPSKAPLPQDSDANGAYNIARKGIMILQKINNAEPDKDGKLKVKLAIKKTDWQNFAQDENRVAQQTQKWTEVISKSQ